jgi:hypothetical protein
MCHIFYILNTNNFMNLVYSILSRLNKSIMYVIKCNVEECTPINNTNNNDNNKIKVSEEIPVSRVYPDCQAELAREALRACQDRRAHKAPRAIRDRGVATSRLTWASCSPGTVSRCPCPSVRWTRSSCGTATRCSICTAMRGRVARSWARPAAAWRGL